MNEWEYHETEREALKMVRALKAGKAVELKSPPGNHANMINDFKEALGQLYRLTYNEEIRISSMTRDVNGYLHVILAAQGKNE